jgi:rSAM/selenodomain-associated transferase 1
MTDLHHNALILFFVKHPEPGGVKTRLAASIGPEKASELYRNFVLDTLEKLKSLGTPFRICFYPVLRKASFINWLGGEYEYAPQQGRDLGERMKAAFIDAFGQGFKRLILIGSDCPDLPLSFLKESLENFNTHDAVIGPDVDGGYYLIGFRDEAFSPPIFEGMDWGTHVVFEKTLAILKGQNRRVHILPPWSDVDTLEDLKGLFSRSQHTDFSHSNTMSYLSRLGDI